MIGPHAFEGRWICFTRRGAAAAACLLAFLTGPSPAAEPRPGENLPAGRGPDSEDWPQWRGPDGTGATRQGGLPVSWSEKEGVRWKIALPGWGNSTPAIWGDALFVTAEDGKDLLLLKLSKTTGKIEWTRKVGEGTAPTEDADRGPQKFDPSQNLASPSPVTDGERVVVHFGNGLLASYDFAGNAQWIRNLQDDHGTYTIWWGHANSPVLHQDLVISVCIQDSLEDLGRAPSPSYVVAHDKRTGKERWKTSRQTGVHAEDCDAYTTPILRATASGKELVVVGAGHIDGYEPLTGNRLWYLAGLGGSRTITSPTAGLGMVFATVGKRGPIVAARPGAGKLPEDAVAWRFAEGTPDSPSLVLWDELLFAVNDDGIAQCLAARTGKLRWKERLAAGSYRASPIAAEGRIYFLNTAGLTTVVSAAAKFEKLSENKVDDATFASPAVSEGRIYLRGRKHLHCLEKGGPPAPAAPARISLFDGKTLEGWKIATDDDFALHGKVEVVDGAVVLPRGDAQTGIAWTGPFPREDYEVSMDAARRDGGDFFCGITFPVGDSPCTLIVGGWGGMVVGLSNVDGNAASENMTTTAMKFEENRWYNVRLRVTRESIEAWIDGKQVIDLEREGHKFTIWSQQEPVLPFGIATWHTGGALKNLFLKKL
jgi:outer membrane protein assembly factor BamB